MAEDARPELVCKLLSRTCARGRGTSLPVVCLSKSRLNVLPRTKHSLEYTMNTEYTIKTVTPGFNRDKEHSCFAYACFESAPSDVLYKTTVWNKFPWRSISSTFVCLQNTVHCVSITNPGWDSHCHHISPQLARAAVWMASKDSGSTAVETLGPEEIIKSSHAKGLTQFVNSH